MQSIIQFIMPSIHYKELSWKFYTDHAFLTFSEILWAQKKHTQTRCTHTHAHTRACARMHAHTHACTHARMHARTHTHTHPRKKASKQASKSKVVFLWRQKLKAMELSMKICQFVVGFVVHRNLIWDNVTWIFPYKTHAIS